LCRVLFKQRHKTQEKAKTRESIRKRTTKKLKMIETMRNHIYHVHTKKKSPIKKVLEEIKCQMKKIWSREFQFSFSLNLIEEEKIVFSINIGNEELWHRRLEHFYHAGLLYM